MDGRDDSFFLWQRRFRHRVDHLICGHDFRRLSIPQLPGQDSTFAKPNPPANFDFAGGFYYAGRLLDRPIQKHNGPGGKPF